MTSSANSNISNARYGYDFVVATTQTSINATMMNFLSTRKEPIVYVCYTADVAGNPVQIDYANLKKLAKGSDPFSIPADADPTSSPDIRNLLGARFMMGFRARLGLPKGANPKNLPDLVTLGSDTASVLFNMLCSEFNIVQLDPGSGWNPNPSWMNESQKADSPWVFTSKVDLRLSTVDSSAYSRLPADIQKKIKNLGGDAFSVQQLLFDLTNASLMTMPAISGIKPGTKLFMILQLYFMGSYFAEMQKENEPLLGCSIVRQSASVSTLALTNFNFEVSPYVDPNGQPFPKPTPEQAQLATLNYLCAADGNSLPPAVAFNWNWVTVEQLNDHDGTIAINRNTFANYFRHQLAPKATKNCILTNVRVWLSGFLDTTVNYSWGLRSGQTPTVTTPATGSTVLRFDWNSDSADEAGLNGDMGRLELRNTYSMTVDFVGDKIIITQHQIVYMYVRSLATDGSGNLVDKQIVDTYTVGIDASGRLNTVLHSDVSDNSNSPSVNDALNFFTNFNDISNDVKNYVRAFAGSNLEDMPVATIQDYVFPGGRTFIFKSVGFSDHQDLVSFISYADPSDSSVVVAPVAPPAEKTIAVKI